MSEDKDKKEEKSGESLEKNLASRARNQTVVLTPELTGQVRAMLGDEDGTRHADPLRGLASPVQWDSANKGGVEIRGESDDGFVKPRRAERSTGKISRNEVVEATKAVQSSVSAPVPSREPVQTQNQAVKRPVGKTKIVAFLISFDDVPQGEVYEIRVGRWLLTSRPTGHEDYILVEDETISPLHAIVRATEEGKIQVLDQLSEHGTSVTKVGTGKEEEITGAMTTLEHGDKVRFGKRHFVVCSVPGNSKSES
jgi:FHA domain